jgi:hypothetical protein
VLVPWTLVCSLAAAQSAAIDPGDLARVLALPRGMHLSTIRADYDAARDRTRLWIDTNEDDLRLWSIPGQQMDMELRVSAVVPGRSGTWPREIDVEFASLGTLEPGAEPHALSLLADGLEVALRQAPEPAVRSGSMVFMTLRTTIGPVELIRLASSSRVEGRIWGHRFALVSSQFEILRAYIARLAER